MAMRRKPGSSRPGGGVFVFEAATGKLRHNFLVPLPPRAGRSTPVQSIAVARGCLVVADEDRMLVLTLRGAPLQHVKLPGRLTQLGLAGLCAADERFYAADRSSSRVIVFKFLK